MGVSHVEPRFVNSSNITGAMYQQGSYAFNYNEDIYLNFTSMFTVRFWAKSSAGAITDDVYLNKIVIVIAGTAISVDIPDTVDLTSWNYFVITRDIENKLDISINGNIIYTDTHAGDFNLNSDGYVYIGNQNRYATGFNFTVDDFVVFDGSVDATDVASDYLDLDTIKQILIIDASGQVWGYSWDGSSSSSGGGADVTTVPSATLSLASETDEVVIPEGITAIRYTLTEDGQEITREIAVESTDTVKYYKEEDGYYTLAVYDNTGAIKSKGYTMHSDNVPNISINYSEDVNNNFTVSDEYNGYVALTDVDYSADTEFVVPAGVTKIEYSAGDSGARIAEVEVGDILEYTADPNDSTKFTLTVYDKDKNKKRDLYTWNNDNLHLTNGTARGNSITENESSFSDISLPDASYIDFTVSGQSASIPAGVKKIKAMCYDASKPFPVGLGSYTGIGKIVEVPNGTNTITFRQTYDMSHHYGKLYSDSGAEFYTTTGSTKYKHKVRMWYGKLINEL